jgi:hypothetical protein
LKEQYAADINDYRKYALLRRLAAGGFKVGVCWMLTAPDDRNDGRKLGYLDDPKRWRDFDPELFEALHPIAKAETNLRLKLVERDRILPRAQFFSEYVPTNVVLRQCYFEVALEVLNSADILFFDPDNGVEIRSTPRGAPNSPKFIYRDEIQAAYSAGHTLLIYQHFPRQERRSFLEKTRDALAPHAPDARIWAFRTADVAYLLLAQPRHAQKIETIVSKASSDWVTFLEIAIRPNAAG